MNNQINQGLVDMLIRCASQCNQCLNSCLSEKEVTPLAACIKFDIDCAEICLLAAGFVSRKSAHAEHVLAECADICLACADECEKHAKHGMEHCADCAVVCRECAEACEGIEHAF